MSEIDTIPHVVTAFRDIKSTDTPFYRDVRAILDRVKDGQSKDLIKKIRSTKDKAERQELKKGLPSICFSGKFNKRLDSAIEEHSGLICLDFDGYPKKKDMLEAKTPKVDAVFLATNAGKVIFSEKQFLAAKPNQVFDLSIPNNASKEDSEKHSCRYIGVEHLGEILAKEEAKYLQLKDSLAKKIKKSLKEISQFLDEKRLSPVITESLENIDQILKSAMDQLPKELQNLDQQQTEALRLWTRRLVKKAKHEHIQQLKKLKKSGASGWTKF